MPLQIHANQGEQTLKYLHEKLPVQSGGHFLGVVAQRSGKRDCTYRGGWMHGLILAGSKLPCCQGDHQQNLRSPEWRDLPKRALQLDSLYLSERSLSE